MKSRKSCGKGSVAFLKEAKQLGCVSQGSPQKKFILREERKLVPNYTANLSKGTWNYVRNRERKGPSQGVMQKCEVQECNP